MNVYDWDNTIYRGDSTADFVGWLYLHYPLTLLSIPRTVICGLLYGFHIIPKLTFKQNLYHMFVFVKDMDQASDRFVETHMNHVKQWYLDQQKPDDMVISASPEFNIRRFCAKLGIARVMASVVDIHTGKYTGLNCHGAEKVRRFHEVAKDQAIDEFYSDSLSDTPLAELAEHAYLVKGDVRRDWPSSEEE
jgi:phosphatidylglycerophosphatase C